MLPLTVGNLTNAMLHKSNYVIVHYCFIYLLRIFILPGLQRKELTGKHLDELARHIHSESELYELADVLGVRLPWGSISPHQLEDFAYFMLGTWYTRRPEDSYKSLTTLLQKAGKSRLVSALQSCVEESLSDKTAAISLSGKKNHPLISPTKLPRVRPRTQAASRSE